MTMYKLNIFMELGASFNGYELLNQIYMEFSFSKGLVQPPYPSISFKNVVLSSISKVRAHLL